MTLINTTLFYVHDPMCSWCWAFRPVWKEIAAALPATIKPARLLGGLAVDSNQPMPDAMRAGLEATWQRIEQTVPGTAFNFDFWRNCKPRRSTYPACRAVIAARIQGAEHEEPMIKAIQHAYYLQARNTSDDSTLVELAVALGLDAQRFAADLASPQTRAMLDEEMNRSRALDADSFPSLVLVQNGMHHPVPYDYRDASVTLDALSRIDPDWAAA